MTEKENLIENLRTILLKINKKIPQNFENSDHFYHDLNIDSLDLTEYVAHVEQEYEIRISDEEWNNLSSINAIVNFLEPQLHYNAK